MAEWQLIQLLLDEGRGTKHMGVVHKWENPIVSTPGVGSRPHKQPIREWIDLVITLLYKSV